MSDVYLLYQQLNGFTPDVAGCYSTYEAALAGMERHAHRPLTDEEKEVGIIEKEMHPIRIAGWTQAYYIRKRELEA